MQQKIEVTDTKVYTKTVKKGDKEYVFHTQNVWLHDSSSPYPKSCFLSLRSVDAFYSPGFYTIQYPKLYIDKYSSLRVSSSPSLLPLEV